MSPITHRRSLAILLLATCAFPMFAAPAIPAPAEPLGSGRYEVELVASLGWHPKAFAGQVEVEEVLAANGPVTAGQKWLTLSAKGLDDALADAKRARAQAERLAAQEEEDARAMESGQALTLQKAMAEKAATQERNAYWQAKDRADSLQKSRDEVDGAEARVKEDREELRQLEQMYKEARIDSSTQDLVVGREQRKLRLSETALDINRRRQAHYAEVEVPMQDAALALAEKEAQWRLENLQRQAAREKTRQAEELEAAKRALEPARKRVADLEADAAALHASMPAAGRLEGFFLKAGDKIKPEQELAHIWDENKGLVRIEVQASALRALTAGAPVHLRFPELNATVGGEVSEVAWAGRPEGGKTLFAVAVKTKITPVSARPGMKVEVVQ